MDQKKLRIWILFTQRCQFISDYCFFKKNKQQKTKKHGKAYKYGVFSGPYFLVFGVNTERY